MATPSLGLGSSYGKIRHLQFEQKHLKFTVAGEGFRLLQLDKSGRCVEERHIDFDQVGPINMVQSVEGLHLAFVVPARMDDSCPTEWHERTKSASCNPAHFKKWSDNYVMLFNFERPHTHYGKKVYDGKYIRHLAFDEKVLGIKCSWKRLAVASMTCVYIYDFHRTPTNNRILNVIWEMDTRPNPKGLVELSCCTDEQGFWPSADSQEPEFLVFPNCKPGMLQIVDVAKEARSVDASRAPIHLQAHEHEIQHISVSRDSTMLATASERGTLIRVFNLSNREQLVELRRGTDQAFIHCISFSRDSKWLCCSSDKGTVHVFALQDYGLNRRSRVASIVPGKYHASQWSYASLKVDSECACICTFDQTKKGGANEQSVVVLSYDGKYHRFDLKDGLVVGDPAYDMFMQCETECKIKQLTKDLNAL